jgi:probable rRNA maturation factor
VGRAALTGVKRSNVLSVRVVGAARSRSLNAQYRNKDRPTNVLSFSGAGLSPDGLNYLGELVICAPVVAREAIMQGKS